MITRMKRSARLLLHNNLARGVAITLILLSAAALFKALETICLLIVNALGFSASAASGGTLGGLLAQMPMVSPINVAVTASLVLLGIVIIAPLVVGSKRWYYRLSSGQSDSIGEVFGYYETPRMFIKSLLLLLDISLRSFLWVYVLLLPGALLGTAGIAMLTARIAVRNARLLGTIAVVMGAALSLLGLIYALFLSLRYFLAPYLFCEQERPSVTKAVRQSVRYMRGVQPRLIGLGCSFLLWTLSCLFILPAIYAVPYMQSTFALFARYHIERGRSEDARAQYQPAGDADTAQYDDYAQE